MGGCSTSSNDDSLLDDYFATEFAQVKGPDSKCFRYLNDTYTVPWDPWASGEGYKGYGVCYRANCLA